MHILRPECPDLMWNEIAYPYLRDRDQLYNLEDYNFFYGFFFFFLLLLQLFVQ